MRKPRWPWVQDAFLDTTSKMQYTKERIDKLDLIEIENFCFAKANNKRMKRQAIYWEKIVAKTHLIKDHYPKYTKNS